MSSEQSKMLRIPVERIHACGETLNIRQENARHINIDKLELALYLPFRSKQSISMDLKKWLDSWGFRKRWIPDARFSESVQYKRGNIALLISSGPRFPNLPSLWVGLNLSYFSNFFSLICFLEILTPNFDPCRSKIQGLDVAADFELPLGEFRRRLRVFGYKRIDTKLSAEGSANFYFGTKPLFRIYDKGEQLRKGKGWLTRMELHLKGKDVPIVNFSDFPRLASLRLFKRTSLVTAEWDSIETPKLNEFKAIEKHLGYEIAHHIFRSTRNFQRDIGKHLKVSRVETADDLVAQELRSFFGGI